MSKINYLQIIKDAWKITWKNRYLWWFGFFVTLGGGGGMNYFFNSGEEEKLDPAESEVEAFIQASAADPSLAKQFESEEQKQVIKSVLRKRKALDMLVALGS